MPSSVKVKNHMQREPVVVSPDDSIYDAIHKILVNKVSGVCVVEEGKIVGVLSELDCLRAILSSTYYEGNVGSVREFMIEDIQFVKPDDDIIEIAKDMFDKRQRRRPVLKDGKLVGLLTCRQILRAVKEFASPVQRSEYGGKE